MYEALFHPAFWMPLALAIVGVAVFVYGNARVQAGVRSAGAGIVGLTVVWCVVAYFVNTPIEQCVNRTNAIVSAVEKGRWDELRTLVDKNTTILPVNLRGPELIGNVTQQNAEGYSLKEIRVLGRTVTPADGAITVDINTLLEMQQSTTASFRFEYEQRSDGILLSRIVVVSVGGLSMEEIGKYVINRGGGAGR